MASLNKVMILGNLGRDPELRHTPSGKAVCTLNVEKRIPSFTSIDTARAAIEALTSASVVQRRHAEGVRGRMIIETVSVLSTERAYDGACITWFHAPQLSAHVEPGQFVMVHCSTEGMDPMFARAFSYYRLDQDRFAVLYNVIGKGTGWLSQRQRGDQVRIYGAAQPEYNGIFSISTASASTFTFTIGGTPVTPATGIIICRQITDLGFSGWSWSTLADGLGRL